MAKIEETLDVVMRLYDITGIPFWKCNKTAFAIVEKAREYDIDRCIVMHNGGFIWHTHTIAVHNVVTANKSSDLYEFENWLIATYNMKFVGSL